MQGQDRVSGGSVVLDWSLGLERGGPSCGEGRALSAENCKVSAEPCTAQGAEPCTALMWKPGGWGAESGVQRAKVTDSRPFLARLTWCWIFFIFYLVLFGTL